MSSLVLTVTLAVIFGIRSIYSNSTKALVIIDVSRSLDKSRVVTSLPALIRVIQLSKNTKYISAPDKDLNEFVILDHANEPRQRTSAEFIPVFETGKSENDNTECGVRKVTSSTRKDSTTPHDWPWIVSLFKENSLFGAFSFCGGSIISSKQVLTAAHCVPETTTKQSFKVRVGEYDFLRTTDSAHRDYKVDEIVRHERYDDFTEENDIALLNLKGVITFGDNVKPICLPPRNIDIKNKVCLAAGWGTTTYKGETSKVLREVPLPIWDQDSCNFVYWGLPVHDSNVCASPKEGGKDVCQGDSGGPLVCQLDDTNKWYIIGVTSWGIKCAEKLHPGVYTRVTSFLDWIAEHRI